MKVFVVVNGAVTNKVGVSLAKQKQEFLSSFFLNLRYHLKSTHNVTMLQVTFSRIGDTSFEGFLLIFIKLLSIMHVHTKRFQQCRNLSGTSKAGILFLTCSWILCPLFFVM